MRHALPLALAGAILSSLAAAQSTWYVDAGGIPPGTGAPDDPYTSIQYAIEQPTTEPGDTLLVAGGKYAEDVDLKGKLLFILGDPGNPANPGELTVVEGQVDSFPTLLAPAGQPAETLVRDIVLVCDPDGAEQVLALQAGAFLRCERVRFEDGRDPYLPDSAGGQVRLVDGAHLQLVGCTLAAVDDIQRGGAIASDGSTLLLDGCELTGAMGFSQGRGGIVDVVGGDLTALSSLFLDGFVDDIGNFGGAIALEGAAAWIHDCDFVDAFAWQAGAAAIYSVDSALTITGSHFEHCGSLQEPGGAIVAFGGMLVAEAGTSFSDCSALDGDGGAIWVSPSTDARFEECLFEGNYATGDAFWGLGDGGAVYGSPTTKFFRCTFAGNTAEGVAFDPSINGIGGAVTEGTFTSCTFYDNQAGTDEQPGEGGAVGAGVVCSSIAWKNSPGPFGPGVVATHSNVEGGWPGEGNIDADPMFVDPAAGDLCLRPGSPSVDAGCPDLPPDPDGTPADQGACTFHWMQIGDRYCSANVNSSGAPSVMGARGAAELGLDFLRLDATDLPPYQYGYFLTAPEPGFVPWVGGGMGNLCLGDSIVRLITPGVGGVLFSGTEGRFDLRARLVALPEEYRPAAGETWHFQAWFRDVFGTDFTSNLSDAVSIAFE